MTATSLPLGEVCEINPTLRRKIEPDEPCSFVPMEAVSEWTAAIERSYVRPFRNVAKGFTPFAERDVLIAKITPCMENGKCAVARNLTNGVGFGSTEFHVLRASDHVLPEWLFYYWRFPETRRLAERNMTGSGGQKRVPTSFLENLWIPIPPLNTQRRIAAQLEQADRLRRTRRHALELSDDYLPSIFLKLFHNHGDLPNVAVEDLLARQPNAIRTGPFGSQLLHSEFTTSGIPVLGIDNAVTNRFEWAERRYISPEKYEQLKRYTVRPRDVMITIMGTCGRCAIIPEGIPTSINTKHICCITLDQTRCLPEYLHAAFLLHPFVRHQLGISQKGAIMDGLNMEVIRNLQIPLPPLPQQQHFARLVTRHQRLRAIQQESLRQAEHLFQTLLKRAFGDSD